jgi:sporulation protein YlmC with PRC-barrel domain
MSEIENIRDWQGKEVLDSGGEKIGTVEDVYFDIETDEPRFLRVKAGWLRHRIVLVPVGGVTASPDHLTVALTKNMAGKAPAMEPGGELSAEFEEKLFGYDRLAYHPAHTPGGRRLVRR